MNSKTSLFRCATLVVVLSMVAACSSQPRTPGGVIIDKRGVNMDQYHADLNECGEFADEVRSGERVVTHSAGGAVVGGAVAGVWDDADASKGATAGAVVGAVKGVSSASAERSLVVKNCMRHRGYVVLN